MTKYSNEYAKANYKHVHVKIPNHKADVVAKIESVKNKNEYIIGLIEADVEREKEEAEALANAIGIPQIGNGRMRNEHILYQYSPSSVKCAYYGKDVEYLRDTEANRRAFWAKLFSEAIEDLEKGYRLNGKGEKNSIEYWKKQTERLDEYDWE